MEQRLTIKYEAVCDLLRGLKLKSFLALKTTKNLSDEQLRVLVALIALYRDFLDDPSLPEKALIENDGVNIELFRAYFAHAN